MYFYLACLIAVAVAKSHEDIADGYYPARSASILVQPMDIEVEIILPRLSLLLFTFEPFRTLTHLPF